VLAAGLGRRLGPLTRTRPKPLLEVAGRPILGHVLDGLADARVEDIVVVVGYLGEQIAAYLQGRLPTARVAVQSPLGGNGDAARAAAAYLDGPLLVLFGDTIVRGDLAGMSRGAAAAIAVAQVADGRSYGIVEAGPDGWVRRLWEKPAVPPSHDAVAGTFFFPEGGRLREALEDAAHRGLTGRDGEVWLTDVVQHMIDRGERVRTFPVEAFYDCGTPERIVEAERAIRAEEQAGGRHRRRAEGSADA
jgi:glucose-1-phosphate thymidylyltransferase